MGKTGPDFDPDAYAPVAERIRQFYQAHPMGRIQTELVTRTRDEVVFKATIYRNAVDEQPAATGWAAEREGDGEINLVACLENTETSAIGRALANLGFTASRQRPSAEEMAKASRMRAKRSSGAPAAVSAPAPFDDARRDALSLLTLAARTGLSPARAGSLRARVVAGCSSHAIERLEAAVRRWLRRRQEAL